MEAIILFLKLDPTLLLPLYHNDILLLLFNCLVVIPTHLISSTLSHHLLELVFPHRSDHW